jgi:hypothetical protein
MLFPTISFSGKRRSCKGPSKIGEPSPLRILISGKDAFAFISYTAQLGAIGFELV